MQQQAEIEVYKVVVPSLVVGLINEIRGEINDAGSYVNFGNWLYLLHNRLDVIANLSPTLSKDEHMRILAPKARDVKHGIMQAGHWNEAERIRQNKTVKPQEIGRNFRFLHPGFVAQVEAICDADTFNAPVRPSPFLVLVARE